MFKIWVYRRIRICMRGGGKMMGRVYRRIRICMRGEGRGWGGFMEG